MLSPSSTKRLSEKYKRFHPTLGVPVFYGKDPPRFPDGFIGEAVIVRLEQMLTT